VLLSDLLSELLLFDSELDRLELSDLLSELDNDEEVELTL
jgi:hypothetical protein